MPQDGVEIHSKIFARRHFVGARMLPLIFDLCLTSGRPVGSRDSCCPINSDLETLCGGLPLCIDLGRDVIETSVI